MSGLALTCLSIAALLVKGGECRGDGGGFFFSFLSFCLVGIFQNFFLKEVRDGELGLPFPDLEIKSH